MVNVPLFFYSICTVAVSHSRVSVQTALQKAKLPCTGNLQRVSDQIWFYHFQNSDISFSSALDNAVLFFVSSLCFMAHCIVPDDILQYLWMVCVLISSFCASLFFQISYCLDTFLHIESLQWNLSQSKQKWIEISVDRNRRSTTENFQPAYHIFTVNHFGLQGIWSVFVS